MSPSRSHHYGEYVANSAYVPPTCCYGAMKLTVTPNTIPPRTHRKVMRGLATKRAAVGQQRINSARVQERTRLDACDNSNDSGLGFDHHVDYPIGAKTALRFLDQDQQSTVKRKKLEIKLETDDPNENFSFPESVNKGEKIDNINRLVEQEGESVGNTVNMPRGSAITSRTHAVPARRMSSSMSLNAQLMGMSRDGKTQLQILCQPEQQHRARYQTEGSRGAVKDRTGNGFPVVKLVGYNKPATLQVFIGTDVGRVAPHMFYQACRVSGKNSTPCIERKIDGTVVIEVDFDPAKDMVITCDCVGILKERNVDVEHRFPDQSGARNKKKSTRCRMVFRTTITHQDGTTELLQATSHPIVCTQPPGVPEICKKSLVACPCTGGMELFILGKNFLKDTRVVFQHAENADTPWEESVLPDKEFLQQTHLVCVVPPYCKVDIKEPVTVRLHVVSSGKTSEPHTFTYTPTLQQPAVTDSGRISVVQNTVPQVGPEMARVFGRSALVPSVSVMLPSNPTPSSSKSQQQESTSAASGDVRPILMWQSQTLLQSTETRKHESKAMPPPELIPLVSRRPSSTLRLIVPDPEPAVSPTRLKTEVVSEDSNSQSSPDETKGMDLRMKSTPSISTMPSAETASLNVFQHFVSSNAATPLPTQSGQSVEKYLSHLEYTNKPTSSRIEAPAFRFSDQQPTSTTSVHFDGGHQKQLEFVRNIPVQNIYGSSTDAMLSHQQPKSQFMASQHKPVFSDNPLTVSVGADAVMISSSVQEPQQGTTIEHSPSSTLLYISESASSGAIINSTPQPQENLPKNSNAMNVPGMLRNLQDSPLLSPSLPSSTASPLLGESLQRVNQVTSSLLAGSQDARLDALVSSAIGDQVCQQIHTSETEKLDALVNSAAVRHMMGSSSSNSVIVNTPEISATASTQPSSTAPVKKMALELSMSSNEVLRRFDIVPLSSAAEVEGNRQLLNNNFTNHIITSGDANVRALSANEIQAGKLTPPANQAVMYSSADQNSPIAMKTIMLNSSTPHSNENQMLPLASPSSHIVAKKMTLNSGIMQDNSPSSLVSVVADSSSSSSSESHIMPASVNSTDVNSPNERQLIIPSTSPIAIKSMIMEPISTISTEPHLRNAANTSPIAMKAMILESAAAALSQEPHLDTPANSSPIAVKNMIMESSDSHMSATTNSQVAIKNMLLESAPVLTTESQLSNANSSSPIAMKTLLLNESIVSASGLNTHPLGTPQPHVSKGKNMDVILEAQSAAPPLLQTPNQASTNIANENLQATTQPQLSIASSSQNMVTGTPAPNAPTGLIKQMLMRLSAEEKVKKDENGATASQEYKMSEVGLFSANRVMKTAEGTQQEKKEQESSQQEKPKVVATPTPPAACGQTKKAEEGMLPQELTQMSENDLISYINPSCFDQV